MTKVYYLLEGLLYSTISIPVYCVFYKMFHKIQTIYVELLDNIRSFSC